MWNLAGTKIIIVCKSESNRRKLIYLDSYVQGSIRTCPHWSALHKSIGGHIGGIYRLKIEPSHALLV
jgi:hypothetical protein